MNSEETARRWGAALALKDRAAARALLPGELVGAPSRWGGEALADAAFERLARYGEMVRASAWRRAVMLPTSASTIR